MKTQLSLLLLAFAGLTSGLIAEIRDPLDLTKDNLADHSEFWPPYALLSEPYKPIKRRGGPLPEDWQLVLLQVEKDGTVLVNFGRYGIERLPLEKTKVLSQARAYVAGMATKEMPIWTYHVGRSLYRKAGDLFKTVPQEEIIPVSGYVLVYADKDHGDPAELTSALEAINPVLAERGTEPVIMMSGFENREDLLHAYLVEHGLVQFLYMRSYHVVPYREAMGHYPEASPFIVAMDADGKIRYRQQEGETYQDALEAVAGMAATWPKAPDSVVIDLQEGAEASD